jgi:hypothetical protein
MPGAGDFEINRKKSATKPLAVLRLHGLLNDFPIDSTVNKLQDGENNHVGRSASHPAGHWQYRRDRVHQSIRQLRNHPYYDLYLLSSSNG